MLGGGSDGTRPAAIRLAGRVKCHAAALHAQPGRRRLRGERRVGTMCGSPNSSPTTIRPPGLAPPGAARAAPRPGPASRRGRSRDRRRRSVVVRVTAARAASASIGRRRCAMPCLARAPHRVVEHLLLHVDDVERGRPATATRPRAACSSRCPGPISSSRSPRCGSRISRRRSRVMNGCGASTQKRCEYGHADGCFRHQSAAPSTAPPARSGEPPSGRHLRARRRPARSAGCGCRASISTGASQSRPEPSMATSWASRIVKNSWSRRFTWSDTRLRYPSCGRVIIPSTR